MVMEMNKSSVNGGRRKSKGSELTQKKNKQPLRGMGVAMLERHRLQDEWKQKMTEMPPSLHQVPTFSSSMAFPTPSSSSSCITVNGGGVQLRHPAVNPGMLFYGNGNGVLNGSSLFSSSCSDYGVDLSVNGGFMRFENSSKELSSIPNYIKCASDGCAICHKKKRINGGSNVCLVNPFRKFCVNTTAAGELNDAGKTRRYSPNQVPEVMADRRKISSLTEHEFFPGKQGGGGGGGEEEELMMMRIGTSGSTTIWCGGASTTTATAATTTCCSVGYGGCYGGGGGMIGLRGGDGSCVTAVTGGEEGSVSSVDLSLKLSSY